MNPKRQVIEKAIIDLRDHLKDLDKVHEKHLDSQLEGYYMTDAEEFMMEFYNERVNIANRLFVPTQASGIQLPNPNSRYYDPNPTPVFNVEDFHDFRRNKSLSYPIILANPTKYIEGVRLTIKSIEGFIKQLERKLKHRKDLQENNPFQLTETKLKKMILEALKNSKFQGFGVPTPDEKLRSDLGDEMFDKIQGLDPEQADVMKQTFDPDYPRDIEQESLNAIIEAAGFKFYDVSKYTKAPTMHARYNARVWEKGRQNAAGSSSLEVKYNLLNSSLRYSVRIYTRSKYGSNTMKSIADGRVSIPPMFELSLKTEQDLRDADAIVLSKEKQAIEQALEQYK